MATRDEILKKYGVTPGASPSATSPSAVASTDAQNAILAKYGVQRTASGYTAALTAAPVDTSKPMNQSPYTPAAPATTKTGIIDSVKGAAGSFVESIAGPSAQATGDLVDAFKKAGDASQGDIGPTLDRMLAATHVLTSAANYVLSPVSGLMQTGEKIPVIKYPIQAVDFVFQKLGQVGEIGATKIVDNLPGVSQETKDKIRPVAVELGVLLSQLAGGELIGKGASAAKDRVAALKTEVTKTIGEDVVNQQQQASIIPDQNNPGAVKIPQVSKSDVLPTTPEEAVQVKTKINEVLTSPFDDTIAKEIAGLSPNEASAFGRTLIDRLNNQLGTEIGAKDKLTVPENVRVFDTEFSDGRPAQFNNGKIELSLPNLLKDVRELARGGELEVHPGGPYQQIFKRAKDESLQDLTVRYTKEVLIHEDAHGRTMTVQDMAKGNKLKEEALAAKRSGNESLYTDKKVELQKHMQSLEDKANKHLAENRIMMEKDLFGGPHAPSGDTVIGIRQPAKFLTNEKSLLKTRVKAIAKGAKMGFKAGEEVGTRIAERVGAMKREGAVFDAKRKGTMALLQERIKGRFAKSDIKSRYKKIIEVIGTKKESAARIRELLIQYSQLVPKDARGEFLRAIARAETGADFRAVVDRMRKVADRKNRKLLKTKILDEIKSVKVKSKNGLPQTKLDIDANRFFQERSTLQQQFKDARKSEKAAGKENVASVYERARAQVIQNLTDWQETQKTNPIPAPIPPEMFRENQILSTIGLDDMTSKQLTTVLGTIREVKELGMTKRALERFNRETETQRTKEAVVEVLKGNVLPKDADKAIDRSWENTEGFGIVKNFFSLEQKGIEDIFDTLSKNDKKSGPNESFISRWGMGVIRNAQSKEFKGMADREHIVNEMFKNVYGEMKPREVMKELSDINTPIIMGDISGLKNAIAKKRGHLVHIPGKVRMADGSMKTLEISRGEAIQYEAHFRDPNLHDSFMNGLGFSEETMAAIRSVLTPSDKKMVDETLKYYAKYYERINEAYVRDMSVDMPFNELYAGPLSRDVVGTVYPESSLLAQEQMRFASVRNGSLKARVDNELAIKPIDVFQNMMHHAAQMEHYIAWEDAMYQMRRVFADPDVRLTVRRYHGKEYMKKIDNYLNDQARGGIESGKRYAYLDAIRANASRHLLGLPNVTTPIKQVAGLASYGVELPMGKFMGGIKNFWRNPIENSKFLYENSPYFQERLGKGYGRDIRYAMEKGVNQQVAGAHTFSELLFIGLRGMDAATVSMGMHAAYKAKFDDLIASGKSKEVAQKEALQYAQAVTERVQEGGSLHEQSEFQRGGSIAQLLTMFISQPNKMYRQTLSGFRNIKEGRGSKVENIRRIVWSWFLAQFTFNIVSNSLLPQQYQQSTGTVAAQTAILGPFSGILLAGPALQTMTDHLFGKTQFQYSPSPATGGVESALKGLDAALRGDWMNSTTFIADAVGWFTGVPTTPFTKPIRNAAKEAKKNESSKAQF